MLIKVENVHFTYPGGVEALIGLSLDIHPGEKVALVGENGSGKTTLARHLNGLLRPQTGKVFIGDWETGQHSPAQMARRVAYIFQNPDEQLFRQSVRDEVAFGPQNLGYSPSQVTAMVDESLSMMGLIDEIDVNPRDLGFSRRKKVAIASALAMQSPILVMDEPTVGMDASEIEQVEQVIRLLHADGKTVVVISHDMDFIAENLDRVVLIHAGRIAEDVQTRDFFTNQALLESSGLDLPQIVRLNNQREFATPALTVQEFLANLKT